MIISQARQRLKGGAITLPDWLLAPLYLHRGAEFWMAHRVAVASARDTIYEVIITSIDDAHWDHLWKLKLTTLDRPGIAEQLCAVLEEHKIQILTAECSVHSRNSYNSMSFILSMADYGPELDGGREGVKVAHRLEFLELSLLATMGEDLVFHQSGRPRIELTRMPIYSYLNDGALQTCNGHVARWMRGKFKLDSKILENVKQYCGSGRIFYAGAVDTENRLVRVLFFPEGDEGVAHIQMGADEFGTANVRKALRHLANAEAKANVLRFQVRRGWQKPTGVTSQPARRPKNLKPVGPGRIDVTFESTHANVKAGAMVAAIREAVAADETGVELHATSSKT